MDLGTDDNFLDEDSCMSSKKKNDKTLSRSSSSLKINDIINKKVGLERTVGLATGISIIMGNIIGSGIFISPKGVLYASNSVGLCLVLWTLCGIISLLGALCYAELGALITESGGDMIYILKGFQTVNLHLGRVLSFLSSWSTTVIIKPSGLAALGLACSSYILGPIIGKCGPPDTIVKLGAVLVLLSGALLAIYSTKLTEKVIVFLTVAKVLALIIVIVGGLVRISQGYTENFKNSFDGSTTNVLALAVGFYGGLFAYDGWNNINLITEEVINPKRNLPIAIFISVPLCMIIYVLVNVSYFTVMSKDELLASEAVAVTWSQAVLGKYFQWVLPTSVALSTFGTITAGLFSSSRLNYVSAREGFSVKLLTMLNVKRNTPVPAVMFTLLLTLIYLIPAGLNNLIGIFSFTIWIFYGLTTVSLLIMRFTMKDSVRVLKVPIIIPILVLLSSIYFVVSPVITDPKIDYLGAIGIVLAGLIFYIPFVFFKLKIPHFDQLIFFFQNLLQVSLPNKKFEN